MSILTGYRNKLSKLKETKQKLAELSSDLPDARYLLLMVDGQIHDYETRLQKLTSKFASLQCDECKQWYDSETEHQVSLVRGKSICSTCLQTISKVLTTQEAEAKWELKEGTIKQDCRRGKLKEYIDCGLIRKSGKYWLIHERVSEFYIEKKKTEQPTTF